MSTLPVCLVVLAMNTTSFAGTSRESYGGAGVSEDGRQHLSTKQDVTQATITELSGLPLLVTRMPRQATEPNLMKQLADNTGAKLVASMRFQGSNCVMRHGNLGSKQHRSRIPAICKYDDVVVAHVVAVQVWRRGFESHAPDDPLYKHSAVLFSIGPFSPGPCRPKRMR